MPIIPDTSIHHKNRRLLYLLSIFLVLFLIGDWALLTKAGYLPNYFEIKFLSSPKIPAKNLNRPVEAEIAPIGSGPIYALKPVIYLYPTHPQNTTIQLHYQGKLTVTYPEYTSGWNVMAYPDGKLINFADQKEYSYLFWEGQNSQAHYDFSSGFVVPGSDTVTFLQEKLAAFGLTPKEYNEFIVYWYPQMKHNPYNLIHFATKAEYDDKAVLDIIPQPDSILRVFMVYKKLDQPSTITPQTIQPFNRHGFLVVEWGGTEIY